MSASFEIKENTVMKYVGDDSHFIIPHTYSVDGIDNAVTTIKESMLKCSKIVEQIVVSEGIENIEKEAFSGCANLLNISLPNSIKSIGKRAFYGCSNLLSIDIPSYVKTLEERTFSYCLKLKRVNFEEDSRLVTIKCGAFRYCDSLNEVVLPDGLKTIEEYAFSSCMTLDKIYIPKSVTKISSDAFAYSPRVVIYASYDSYAREYCEKMRIECVWENIK